MLYYFNVLNYYTWVSDKITDQIPIINVWIVIFAIVVLLCFLTGEITGNYSQTDKLWSLMPIIYGWVTVAYFPFSARLWLMAIMVTIWGARLTYNFYRKGGYSIVPWKGEEDYRWKYLRELPVLKGRIKFALFNLFFISFYQHFLILLFSSPFLVVAKSGKADISFADFVIAAFMLLFIVIETIADNQQYSFQRIKRGLEKNTKKYIISLEKGFLTEGLWRYARHPNYAAEQAIWICFYFFSVVVTGQWINWSLSGAILLVLLFQGSTLMTEKISSSKYPDYENYKKNVPAFIPYFFKSSK